MRDIEERGQTTEDRGQRSGKDRKEEIGIRIEGRQVSRKAAKALRDRGQGKDRKEEIGDRKKGPPEGRQASAKDAKKVSNMTGLKCVLNNRRW